jgi:hypothetical protein
VYAPLSCASSICTVRSGFHQWISDIRVSPTMMTLYRLNNGSTIVSRNSIPSVMYLIRVLVGDDRSSNRIE